MNEQFLAPGARFRLLQHLVRLVVVVLGFTALQMGGELGGVRALAALLAVVASCWPGRPRLALRNWLIVQVAFLLWLLGGAALFNRHLITLFAELLVFVQVHRLLTCRRARDDFYLCFIAFGQVLISSVLTIDLLYLVLFGGFTVAVAWALVLARLAVTVEQRQPRRALGLSIPTSAYAPLDRMVAVRPLLVALAMGLLLLGSTTALFFVLPRMQASFLQAGFVTPLHVSGFAERVHLGDVGSLKLSSKPVMRVKVHDRRGEPVLLGGLYWHGLALDHFDGRNWELSEQQRIELSSLAARGEHGPPRNRDWTLRQQVTLEPLDSDVLFGVAETVGIYGEFRRLEAVSTEGYFLPGAREGSGGRVSYTVYSRPRLPNAEALRGQDPRSASDELLERYTQLPTATSPRIAELAEEWTATTATAVDAALVLQNRLRREYGYSLDQEASVFADPVLAFLEEVKEGHCEYFATSMTLLLRARGIPSRMVNGFYGGEWNPVGEYWLVRQRDAHSWVEIYFPGTGWVIFDPTPDAGTGLTGRARIQLLARLAAWADYAELRWKDVLLDYGLDTQVEGFRSLVAALKGWGTTGEGRGGLAARLFAVVGSSSEPGEQQPGASAAWSVLLLLLLLVTSMVVLLRTSAWSVRLSVASRERHLCRLVARLEASWLRAAEGSLAPATPQTTLAWARWAAACDPVLFARAPQAIERYYRVRFGGREASRELLVELGQLARLSRGWRPAARSAANYSKNSDQRASVS